MSNLGEKDKRYVWHPFTQVKTASDPIQIASAKGAKLIASDGKEYIDINSSWWVNVHGHGVKEIGDAIKNQFDKLDHVIFADVTHPSAVELAEKIVEKLGEPLAKVFFSDNGSTAIEVALKMAIQYWYNKGEVKPRIMAMEGAYHGDTFGAMAVGERGFFNVPFEPYFFNVDFIDFPNGSNDQEILSKAERLFHSGEFGVLILEPLIQGSAGMRIYSVEFLEKLVDLARKYGVLVIFDEVMTAFGRTGELFAFNHTNVHPDLICLSKGLTGGVLPLGLTVTTNDIFNGFLFDEKVKGFLHGHSFTGNPLSCAAALASLKLFEEEETWNNVKRISLRHQEFAQILSPFSVISNVRYIGTILAFDITTTDRAGYFASVRDSVYLYMLEKGIFLRPLGNCIYLNPPYCISDQELSSVYDAVLSFLKELEMKNN
jgi:adenosylmethionine-8-amino-7-oxononanoate aminotransferase